MKREEKATWTGRQIVTVLSGSFLAVVIFFVTTFDATMQIASATEKAKKSSAEPDTNSTRVIAPVGSRNETVIVFIGDSLTQGYGVRAEEAYPELVGNQLREKGYSVKIINGGISGSVTAEADRRLRWYLRAKPQIVVLALGANDGMKGAPPEVIEKNLKKAIDLAKANNIDVVLAGLKMFTNLGDQYLQKYEAIFPRLAREAKVQLIPFLLEDVALQKEYNLSDMRHPNPKGHEIIANRVTKSLEALLKKRNRSQQSPEANPQDGVKQ